MAVYFCHFSQDAIDSSISGGMFATSREQFSGFIALTFVVVRRVDHEDG